jgi:hypothetical protein
MKENTLIKVLVVISFLGMIVVNGLANALPINNLTTGEISNAYPNLFAPMGLTFSIWGLIYFLLALAVLFQCGLWQKDKEKRKQLLNQVGIYFIISSLANISWIFAWHHRLISLSLLLIIVILLTLIKIVNLLKKESFSLKEKILIQWPFSLYLGWITVATIANVTVFLVSINWSGFGLKESTWTVIVLLVATLIGLRRMLKNQDMVYGLVFIWAYLGIWLKHTLPQELGGQYPSVITTVIICSALFLIAQGFLGYKKYKSKF